MRLRPLVAKDALHTLSDANVPTADLTRLEDICRRHGLFISDKRRALIRVLSEMNDHPTAKEIHTRAKALDPGVRLPLIYRTLAQLEQAGIVRRTHFGDGAGRYELAGKARHNHITNLETGELVEFSSDVLDAMLRRMAEQLGYELIDYRLDLMGRPEGR
jgi:Fur family ferric uptake transcriptional regulator